jgi:hypothetical protein
MSRTLWIFIGFMLLAIVVVVMTSLWGAGVIDKPKPVPSNEKQKIVNIPKRELREKSIPLISEHLKDIYQGVFVRVCDEKTVESEWSVGEEFTNDLEKLGWSGLLISPLVSEQKSTKIFQSYAIVGPEEGFTQNTHSSKSTPTQKLLHNVLTENKIKSGFDLLLLDNAGLEWEAIRNFDFQHWQPKYILIDLNHTEQTKSIKTYLLQSGYYIHIIDQNYTLWSFKPGVISKPLTSFTDRLQTEERQRKLTNVTKRDDWYNNYVKVCQKAVQKDDVFMTFKQNPDYNVVLEHLTKNNGAQYVNEIERLYAEHKVLVDWEKATLNDTLGGPVLYKYQVPINNHNVISNHTTITISPTSLRYVCLGMKILEYVRTLGLTVLDFVEIGGGYGGQCFMLHQLAEKYNIMIRSYTIFDLPEASALQQKYLTKLLLADDIYHVKFMSPWQKEKNLRHDSFLFSSYALGEISVENQELYYTILSPYISHGYIIWNSDKDPTENFYNMTNGKDHVHVSEERPKTFHWNKVLTF